MDVTCDLSSFSFQAGLSDDEKRDVYLRARSAGLTLCGCAHAGFLCKLMQSLRCAMRSSRCGRSGPGAPGHDLRVGILGMGHLGRKLLLTLLETFRIKASNIKVSTRRPEAAAGYVPAGVECFSDNGRLASWSDVLFVCCLPCHLPTVCAQLHSHQPSVCAELHSNQPTVCSQLHSHQPTVCSQLHSHQPSVCAELHSNQPTVCAELHSHQPTVCAELHSHQPTVCSQLHSHQPTVCAQLHSHLPTVCAELHSHQPTVCSQLHSHKPSVCSQLHSHQPSVCAELHSHLPTVCAELHSYLPTVCSQLHSHLPTVCSQLHSHQPTVCSQLHSHQPSVCAELHSHQPSVCAELHSNQPTVCSQLHSHQPTVCAELHSHQPTVCSQLHSHQPTVCSQLHSYLPRRCLVYVFTSAVPVSRLVQIFEHDFVLKPKYDFVASDAADVWLSRPRPSDAFRDPAVIAASCPVGMSGGVSLGLSWISSVLYILLNMCSAAGLGSADAVALINTVLQQDQPHGVEFNSHCFTDTPSPLREQPFPWIPLADVQTKDTRLLEILSNSESLRELISAAYKSALETPATQVTV